MPRHKFSLYGTLAITAVILLLLNFISSRVSFRWDATDEKIYSISTGSKKIAEAFKEPVQVKLYFSKNDKDVPPAFKAFGKRVIEVLKIYQANNRAQINVEVIDPQPDSNEEEWARKSGLQPIRLPSGSDYFLGAVLAKGEQESVIPYLDPRREEFLEYDIAEAFLKLQSKEQKKIGIISSFDFESGRNAQQQTFDARMSSDWAFVQALARTYEVTVIKATSETLPTGLASIIVLHAKDMSEKLKYHLDQYLMQGGHLFVAVDPFSRVQLALSAATMQSGQIPKFSSKFSPWLEKWGITYNDSEIVGDQLLATPINAGGENVNYPFFMTLLKERGNINANHQITSQLRQLVIAEGGAFAFDQSKAPGLTWTPLIETTKNGGTGNANMAVFMRPSDLTASFKVDNKSHTLAALMTGPFASAYDRALEGEPDFLAQAKDGAAVILVADVDMFHDANSVDRIQMGPQIIIRPRNDNLAFLLNSIDLLSGGSELLSIRKSGTVARPFTRVQELQQKAGEKWRSEEEKLSKQLTELQTKLQQLQAQRSDENRLALTAEQEQEIARFRAEEAAISKQRREVRKKLREDIETLGHILAFVNLTLLPLIIGIAGVVLYRYRTRRRFNEVSTP